MPSLELFAIGTPVVDYFCNVKEEELGGFGLVRGSTNHMSGEGLDRLLSSVKIISKAPGDNARNLCEGFSFLGGKCGYAGAIGKDKDGKVIGAGLEKAKIQSFLEEIPGKGTGKILCLISEGGERTFAADLGASLDYSRVEVEEVSEAGIFCITPITTSGDSLTAKKSREAMRIAHEAGAVVAYCLESPKMISSEQERVWREISDYAGIVLGNEGEFAALGRKEEEILNFADMLCVKKGEKGSVVYAQERSFLVPPAKVDGVVDTTGAGDAYNAGFLFGLSQGKGLEECGRIGSELAGKVIGKVGAGLAD